MISVNIEDAFAGGIGPELADLIAGEICAENEVVGDSDVERKTFSGMSTVAEMGKIFAQESSAFSFC